MATTKKYYWLKLKEDFFRNKKIKKLRRIAGGDTFTIIYLKMQLLSLKDEGALLFEGVEDNFAEEIALEIDEDPDNVKLTVAYLLNNNLLEEIEPDRFILPETIENIGSESSSAARVRKHRKIKAEEQNALQCNALVTNGNTEIEKEIEIDLEIEKREETDYKKIISMYNEICISFPGLRTLSDSRKKAIKARINSGYTYEDFKTLFEEAQNSSFLKGKNDRNWSATFDWMLKDSNMAKVLEGNYRDKGSRKKEQTTDNPFLKIAMEMDEND